ncbi:MAG: hypothetical protein FWF73_03870 [Spirochaetes bacterium]|nr:hypothetical protein [Spirochaetota bacterium]
MYNGEIISYEINRRPVFDMVLKMLKKGLERKTKDDNLYFTPVKDGITGWKSIGNCYGKIK